ncbi:MAG: alpha/beta fold hydrolase [Candidatus Heimdallarchaeota archaeon]|nr:alpha/beta fold hydrolase [Candidatus Heimdallarchaeota archaeon]
MFIPIKTAPDPSSKKYLHNSWRLLKNIMVSGGRVIGYPFMAIAQASWPRSIDRSVKEHAEEYYWHPGGNPDKAVLLIHGFATSPQIFREFAKLFLAEGYIAYGVRIEGHGTSEADLASTTSVDWYLSIRERYIELKSKVDEVLILGHSLGGLIGLILSSLYPVSSIILLSVPIIIKPTPLYRANFMLRPLSNVVKYWPSKRSQRRQLEELGFIAYEKYPLRAVAGLFEMAEVARSRLKDVTIPVLAMIGEYDEHVDPSTIEYFDEHLATDTYFKWIAPDAGHSIIETPEADLLKQKIRDFVHTYSPLGKKQS